MMVAHSRVTLRPSEEQTDVTFLLQSCGAVLPMGLALGVSFFLLTYYEKSVRYSML
jgi:hypothetical protein